MKRLAIAALVGIGAPLSASPATNAVDAVIAHLDLTSFPNIVGAERLPGRRTFADYGFGLANRTADGATLVRRRDGRSKSFTVLSNRPEGMRLCFHDRFTVMPRSAAALKYDTTTALYLAKTPQGQWASREIPGGVPGCHGDPAGRHARN
jgi:hypothetical protein